MSLINFNSNIIVLLKYQKDTNIAKIDILYSFIF